MAKIECNVKFNGKIMMRGKYIGAAEFEGGDHDYTIKSIEQKDVEYEEGEDSEEAWIVSFEETARQLSLNKTNCAAIGNIHGDNANEWIGKRVTLYPARVKAFGIMQDAVRVRPNAPNIDPNTPKKPEPKSYAKKEK